MFQVETQDLGDGMNKKERDCAIIELWLRRAPEERTRNHVLGFYHWLEQNRRDLVPVTRGGKDPYQSLQSVLTRHILGDSRT